MIEIVDRLARRVDEAEEVSKAELLAVLAHAHHGESIPIRAAKEQGAAINEIGRSATQLREKVGSRL